jgi:DNA-binding CsgD family transcriptional regulator
MALSIEAWEEAIIATGWQSALDRGQVDAEPVKAVLDRMDRMARHVTTARGLLTHAILASDLLLKAGRLEEARLRARSGWEVARTHGLGSSFSAGLAVSNAVEASCELGDVSGAEALVASFMRARDRPDDQVATSLLAGVTAPIDLLRGRTQPVELDHRLGDEFHREVLEVRIEQLLWHGDPATGHGAAVEGLTRLLRPQTALDRPLGGYLLTLAARAAADLGDVALIEETQAIRSRFVDLGDDPLLARPAVGRIRGDAATWEAELARGRDVDSVDRWRDVARVWEELGYRHRAAYAWWRAAQRSLREPVDRSAAADSLRRAYGLATEHEPLLRAVRELADRLRVAGLGAVDSLPIRDRHESLTQQEQRVLRLVAHGRTNAEIAAELFISPKTASVHVSNILRKLGVGNRAAAAGWAATVGLTDRPTT